MTERNAPRLLISQLSRISINIKRSSPPLGDARERTRCARARKRWLMYSFYRIRRLVLRVTVRARETGAIDDA
jgi:hypothetical protein